MSIANIPTERPPWDGHDRRFFNDPDYVGPERRLHLSARDRAADARLRTLEHQVAGIAVVMQEAVAAGMRQALTDPRVLSQVWEAAMKQGQAGLHQRAGRWLFSRWTAILVMVFLLASYIGWPATAKLLFGLVKGDG